MALPSNPNKGGLPQRPGLPQRASGNSAEGLPPMPTRGSNELANAIRESASQSLPEPEKIISNDRLSEYDFGSQRAPLPSQQQRTLDEDPFETISPSQAVYEDDDDDSTSVSPARPEPIRAPNDLTDNFEDEDRISRRDKRAAEEFNKNQGRREKINKKHNEYRPQAGELDQKGQNVFVDKKSKKVKPFGGKKSIKVADVDPRKNLRQQARIVQTIIILLLVAVVGFGAYNALVPKPTLTTNDVVKTVQQTVRITNFPLEGGEGFAKDFMQSYLTLGTDPAAQTVLNYFYTGRMIAGAQQYPNRNNERGYGQEILFGPTVYGAQYLTDNAANYTIGALVQPMDTKPTAEIDADGNPIVAVPTSSDATGAVWQFFSVNVYYNQETLQYSITPDSPTLIPAPQNLATTGTPTAAPIGTGKEIENPASVKAIIQGFIEAYRVSTPTDHIKLDTHIPNDPDVSLLDGLGGTFEFSKGAVESAVQYKAYATDTAEIKAHITVAWEHELNDGVRTTYRSQYIMTIMPTETGFVVTKFAPYYFVPEQK